MIEALIVNCPCTNIRSPAFVMSEQLRYACCWHVPMDFLPILTADDGTAYCKVVGGYIPCLFYHL